MDLSDEDLERLASRIASLAGDEEDAELAGRAVAGLARRLNLSPDDLKSLLLAGATTRRSALERSGLSADAAARIAELERELANVRHNARLSEAQMRNALRERDGLKDVNEMLVDSLDRARSAEQVRKYVGLAVVAAAVLGGIVLYALPNLHTPSALEGPVRPVGSPFLKTGIVRANGARVLAAPLTNADLITQLTAGSRVQVRQTITRDLLSWVEIEVGGLTGYVLSSEIELP